MRGAKTLAAKDRAVEEAASASDSKLFATNAERPTASPSSLSPDGQFCVVSALRRVAHSAERKRNASC
jgi:hypothetical protein